VKDKLLDLIFPICCLMASVTIAINSLGAEDADSRNQGLSYAATMLTIAGATYHVTVKSRDND
jgi:hypothetical protein